MAAEKKDLAPRENENSKSPWVAPRLLVMSAGAAENAVTPNDDNGINFS